MVMKLASALLGLYASVATAVHPLKVSGADFVDSVTNDRFEIIGVAYQPGGSSGFDPSSGKDPLSDSKTCLRDAILMQSLGINTIRVYNLDPQVNHDDCATIFNSAGIYMIIDVNSPLPNESLNAAEPWTSYNKGYLKRVFQVVENFMGYDNLLGFFSGNEVINDETSGGVDPPYVRAVTRDIKNYISKNSKRDIPVGYSAADVRDILVDSWQYLQCSLAGDDDNASRIDFFGLNSYSWCGSKATYQSSGFDDLVSDFTKTTIPIFFSEYGCNKVQPRTWTEVLTLYGEQMRTVFSGGVVYEWTQEDNDFGLVQVDGNDVKLLTDFDNLQTQMNKLDVQAITARNSTATSLKPPQCAKSLIQDSSFSNNFTIPAVPPGVSSMIASGVTGGATGKLQSSPSATVMPYTVEGSSGKAIKGLSLKVLKSDESNTPSSDNSTSTSGDSASGTGSSASASSSGVAAGVQVQGTAGVLAAGLLGMLLL